MKSSLKEKILQPTMLVAAGGILIFSVVGLLIFMLWPFGFLLYLAVFVIALVLFAKFDGSASQNQGQVIQIIPENLGDLA